MSHMLLIQITLTVVAIIAIIGFFLIYSRGHYGIVVKVINRKDKIVIILLTSIYGGLSFYHLGSTSKYETNWYGRKHGDQLTITFAKPVSLSRVYYSVSELTGSFSFKILSDKNKELSYIPSNSSYYGVQPTERFYRSICYRCFQWNFINIENLNSKSRIKSLVFEVDQPLVEINKIVVVDLSGNVLTNYNVNQRDLIANTIPDIGHYSSMYFDEMYYAVAAYNYLHGELPQIQEHPQLTFFITLIGIIIFGMSPFGWRFMSCCCGIMIIPIMYIFAKRLFKCSKIAIILTILMMSEFLQYTMIRTVTLELFVTFFLILEYYCLYLYLELRISGLSFKASNRYLLYTIMLLGISSSCKWTGLFSLFVIVSTILYSEIFSTNKTQKSRLLLILLMMLLPILIYVLPFIPAAKIMHIKNLYRFVYLHNIIMFDTITLKFHSTPLELIGSSRWWEWPFNHGSMVIVSYPLNINNISRLLFPNKSYGHLIVLFSNPAISILTGYILLYLLYRVKYFFKIDISAFFILLIIIAQYLTFAFIQRRGHFFYFYTVIPFIILGTGNILKNLMRNFGDTLYKYFIWFYVIFCIILFISYFPIISGLTYNYKTLYSLYRSIIPVTLSEIILFSVILLVLIYNKKHTKN